MYKYWLECYDHSSILSVDPLSTMKKRDFDRIVHKYPKRYREDVGMYYVWGDGDQYDIQPFTETEINCEKYSYHLLTDRWVETLKDVKTRQNLFQIEWGPKVIKKGKYDQSQYGDEEMPTITFKELCDLFKVETKNCPFDGLWLEVKPEYKGVIQKHIKHKLDFNKHCYSITNKTKMLNSAVWEKWLPID